MQGDNGGGLGQVHGHKGQISDVIFKPVAQAKSTEQERQTTCLEASEVGEAVAQSRSLRMIIAVRSWLQHSAS